MQVWSGWQEMRAVVASTIDVALLPRPVFSSQEAGMPTNKPLTGIRVVEIGHGIPAPYASMFLGEPGADVIKVESPRSY
jgi:hypothetical protein